MFEPREIETRIQNAMPDAQITVKDLTGGKDHYEVQIVSAAFEDKSLLERHRIVYDLFRDVMGGALHALSLKTQTPAEAS